MPEARLERLLAESDWRDKLRLVERRTQRHQQDDVDLINSRIPMSTRSHGRLSPGWSGTSVLARMGVLGAAGCTRVVPPSDDRRACAARVSLSGDFDALHACHARRVGCSALRPALGSGTATDDHHAAQPTRRRAQRHLHTTHTAADARTHRRRCHPASRIVVPSSTAHRHRHATRFFIPHQPATAVVSISIGARPANLDHRWIDRGSG